MKLICSVPACTAKVVVPETGHLGWIAAICGFGHSCWVVRAVGKTVIMRRKTEPGLDPAPIVHPDIH